MGVRRPVAPAKYRSNLEDGHRPMAEGQDRPLRAVVAAVQLSGVSDLDFDSSVNELRELAKTLGFELVGTFTQKREHFDTTAYMGIGKRQEMRRFVENKPESKESEDEVMAPDAVPRAAKSGAARAKEAAKSEADPETRRADIVLVDHEISPSQARNLEIEVGVEVMDRTMVILEIFHRHARSRAARAQVEIARLGYLAPRLREQAKLAGPKGRQRSGTGGRGAGEAHSAMDRQKIRDRIAELQQEIDAMDAERKTQKARRQEGQGLARVVLVGYTNAGKSTLMRALTGSEVLVANKLFATLDTTVRALHPEVVPRVLVSDTVGFIKNLPHDLVASFKSTLEEAAEASLLLHVIDANDSGFERQLAVTDEVLAEIGAQDVPRLRVFNKIDCVGEAPAQAALIQALRSRYPDCVVMSALRRDDVAAMHDAIQAFFEKDLVEAELFLPWTAQQLRGEIFANCKVIEESAEETGSLLRIRGTGPMVRSLQDKLAQAA
ncbi:MAG TPA: GTPase HflX [Burkholderiales bacterium]|nr:GTPase HflX [Burkholderiales bacterium]